VARAKNRVLIHSVSCFAQAEQWEHCAVQVAGWAPFTALSLLYGRAASRDRHPGLSGRLRPRLGRFGQCLATSQRLNGREQAGNTRNRSLHQHNTQHDRHRNSQRCSGPRPWWPQHSYVHHPGAPRPSTHATMRTRRLYSSNDSEEC
jgi:hypothetical protein